MSIVTDKNGQYYLAFSYFFKIGPAKLKRLEVFFPNIAAAFHAQAYYLERAGLEPSLAAEFIRWRKTFDISRTLAELAASGTRFITWHDPLYPALLEQIPYPPPVLFYWGDWQPEREIKPRRLAVVGSRQPSAYAAKVIGELLPPIITSGVEIISGLALGVDALAHQATVMNNGRTIAVLGSGLDEDHIYPRENRPLLKNILASGGLVISEFPPGVPALKTNFPRRNRIIAGLAQATLIVEARVKSGALITAGAALEQNREVLAVPGNIFSELSAGPNNLIKEGAKSATCPEDIGEVFGLAFDKTAAGGFGDQLEQWGGEEEKIVYEIIRQAAERGEKISADEIISQAASRTAEANKLDTATINSILSILEIKEMIASRDGAYELKN